MAKLLQILLVKWWWIPLWQHLSQLTALVDPLQYLALQDNRAGIFLRCFNNLGHSQSGRSSNGVSDISKEQTVPSLLNYINAVQANVAHQFQLSNLWLFNGLLFCLSPHSNRQWVSLSLWLLVDAPQSILYIYYLVGFYSRHPQLIGSWAGFTATQREFIAD